MDPYKEAAASVRLDGETIDVGPVTVGKTLPNRPDPRIATSWCREGVTHDHDACGRRWNSADPADVQAAARWTAARTTRDNLSITDAETALVRAIDHATNIPLRDKVLAVMALDRALTNVRPAQPDDDAEERQLYDQIVQNARRTDLLAALTAIVSEAQRAADNPDADPREALRALATVGQRVVDVHQAAADSPHAPHPLAPSDPHRNFVHIPLATREPADGTQP